LEVVFPWLPACLADPEAIVHLLALGRALPGDMAAVLETRLSPPNAAGSRSVDLSLRIATPAQALALSGSRYPSTGWQSFLRAWAARPAWRASAPALWLEYDLKAALPCATVAPIVIAQLSPAADERWVAETLLPAMRGAALAPEQRALFGHCWRQIPPRGRALYAFALLARGTDAVRMEIGGDLDLEALAAFLTRVEAPEAAADIGGLRPLFPSAARLHLSLDLGAAVLPRVGLEVSFSSQPPRDLRWSSLLSRLSAAGLCSAAARSAALAWPGQDSFWNSPSRWPVAGGAAADACVRCLSHVKLIRDGQHPIAAKLYLLLTPLAAPRDAKPS
jgi:hypothetical protein